MIRKFEENEKHHDTDVQALMDSYYEKFFNSPERFNTNYNTPESFRAGFESKDIPMYTDDELPEQRIYFDEEDDLSFLPDDYGSGFPKDSDEIFRELKNAHDVYKQQFQDVPDLSRKLEEYENEMRNPAYLETNDVTPEIKVSGNGQPVMYTEGGMVYAPSSKNDGKYRIRILITNLQSKIYR